MELQGARIRDRSDKDSRRTTTTTTTRRDKDRRRRDKDRRLRDKYRRRSDKVSKLTRINDKRTTSRDDQISDEGLTFQPVSTTNSGGLYIPPFRLTAQLQDKSSCCSSSFEYQKMTWDALKKSINGLVNKVNAANIKHIIPKLFSENLVRGRALFAQSCIKSQMASPAFTDVFAALVAVLNSKFPDLGSLLLRRVTLRLRRAYKRNDKHQLLSAAKFIAHLVNQHVVHELLPLELLTLLLENPTEDGVEVAVGFVTECGSMLEALSPKALHGIFERFRGILHEGEIDKRVQFLIEGLFALRRAKFQGHPAVRPELDLVELEDQITHEVSLLDEMKAEDDLVVFKLDPNFLENEKRYEDLKKTILCDEFLEEDGGDEEEEESDDESDESSQKEDVEQMRIVDETETDLVNLRRTIYLTIMSSVDFEEAGHKLLQIKLEPGQEIEVCIMLLECASQERTYLRYYGLLGQRFCMFNKVYQEDFEKCFVNQYSMIHRLETNKLRNVAKFFAHLLGTDALPWHVLAYIRLTEEDTTSSSRIFIKILFQELSEHLGVHRLNERLGDPSMQVEFESIFPRDSLRNTRKTLLLIFKEMRLIKTNLVQLKILPSPKHEEEAENSIENEVHVEQVETSAGGTEYKEQYVPRRSWHQRGNGRSSGGGGRGGRGYGNVPYQNGRNQYFEQQGNNYPRNYYGSRGRGGRGNRGGGSSNSGYDHHASRGEVAVS